MYFYVTFFVTEKNKTKHLRVHKNMQFRH